MNKELLLQVTASDLEAAKNAVEAAIGSPLQAHESLYLGGEYFRGVINDVLLILQENFIEDDGEPTEAEFPQASILIYLDGEASSVDEVAGRMGALIKLLRVSTD